MSKRKVQFNEEVESIEIEANEDISEEISEYISEDISEDKTADKSEAAVKFGKKFKHTLDSDEEDDEIIEQNYNVLDSDQIEGQEDATVDQDGEVQITPFNMKEELETGHFDKEGNYIFDKTEEIRDNWLDHIDWIKIKDKTNSDAKNNESGSDDESDHKKDIDLNDIYRQMIELMEPKESVQKAIQRLGKSSGKVKSSERWKKNKEIQLTEEQKQSKEILMKLSSLADQVLQTGDMNVYEKTYEQLVFTLKKSSEVDSTEGDMFSDDFDSTKKLDAKNGSTVESNEIKWEFKWEDKDSAPVFGPHTSDEMLGWVNDGYFKEGVYVRQINKSDSQFYSSKRIDFDLFT